MNESKAKTMLEWCESCAFMGSNKCLAGHNCFSPIEKLNLSASIDDLNTARGPFPSKGISKHIRWGKFYKPDNWMGKGKCIRCGTKFKDTYHGPSLRAIRPAGAQREMREQSESEKEEIGVPKTNEKCYACHGPLQHPWYSLSTGGKSILLCSDCYWWEAPGGERAYNSPRNVEKIATWVVNRRRTLKWMCSACGNEADHCIDSCFSCSSTHARESPSSRFTQWSIGQVAADLWGHGNSYGGKGAKLCHTCYLRFRKSDAYANRKYFGYPYTKSYSDIIWEWVNTTTELCKIDTGEDIEYVTFAGGEKVECGPIVWLENETDCDKMEIRYCKCGRSYEPGKVIYCEDCGASLVGNDIDKFSISRRQAQDIINAIEGASGNGELKKVNEKLDKMNKTLESINSGIQPSGKACEFCNVPLRYENQKFCGNCGKSVLDLGDDSVVEYTHIKRARKLLKLCLKCDFKHISIPVKWNRFARRITLSYCGTDLLTYEENDWKKEKYKLRTVLNPIPGDLIKELKRLLHPVSDKKKIKQNKKYAQKLLDSVVYYYRRVGKEPKDFKIWDGNTKLSYKGVPIMETSYISDWGLYDEVWPRKILGKLPPIPDINKKEVRRLRKEKLREESAEKVKEDCERWGVDLQ